MPISLPVRNLLATLLGTLLLTIGTPAAAASDGRSADLEADFRQFLPAYIQAIEARDTAFLVEVHPDLPAEMTGFFFDVTRNMMAHARANDLEPTIACREYGVCTVTWPQPGDHWAAQSFIRHAGQWRWLAE